MLFYTAPEHGLDYAIEYAARMDEAWIVIPCCINKDDVEDKVYSMGFGDIVNVCTWNNVPFTAQAVVIVYPDLVLTEMFDRSTDSYFENNSAVFLM